MWADLAGGATDVVAQRLRQAGYPLVVQRAILAALIAQKFAAQHHALADEIAAFPWWRGSIFNSPQGSALIAERQKLQHEEKAEVDKLLGGADELSGFAREEALRRFGNLPEAKLGDVNRISSDYAELAQQVRSASQGILLPEDREKLKLLDQEKQSDLAALLTPDELAEYNLHASPTANLVRTQMGAFKPTEDEYHEIFQIAQSTFGTTANPETMTQAERQQLNDAKTSVLSQLVQVLPADRLAELTVKTDPSYVQADLFVQRQQLPDDTTAAIVAVQKDITSRATAIASNSTLSSDDRAAQLASLNAEANARLGSILGPDTLTAYKQSTGGWVNALVRRPGR